MSNYQPKKKYLSQLRHTSHDEDVQSLQHDQYHQHVNMMSKQDNNMMMSSQVGFTLPPMNGLSNSPKQVHSCDPFKPQMCFTENRPPEAINTIMGMNNTNLLARMQNDYQVDMYMQNSSNFSMGMGHNMHYDAKFEQKKSRQHVDKVESFMWPHGTNTGVSASADQHQPTYNQMFVHSGDVSGIDINNPNLSPLSPRMMGDNLPQNMSHETISPSSRSLSASEEMSVLRIKEEVALVPGTEAEEDQVPRMMSNQIVSPRMMMNHHMSQSNLSPGLPKNFYHRDTGNTSQFPQESGVSSSLLTPGLSSQKPLLTSSGRNKGSGKPLEPKHACQVCGDVAAGFHCGAYVCEACKKFFLRCLKTGRGLMFLCPKNSNCDITKETRSHCQRCRYQRCIELAMYKPGREDDKKLKVDFRSIPCKVCKAPSSGFHFGAITCEGCKGFFRRMLKEQVHRKFVCSNDERCNIDSANRTTCKSCRFAKCLKIGMTLEGTRLGRQSNSVKRGVIIQCLPNRRHLLNERSLSVDAATSEASSHANSPPHLTPDPSHPSTLRRLLSEAEASRQDHQSIASEDEGNADVAIGTNMPHYVSDDVFLRSSERNSTRLPSSSSNKCISHYETGDARREPASDQRLTFSNGDEISGYQDARGSAQFCRRDDQERSGIISMQMQMHVLDSEGLSLPASENYLPLKSEPMEINDGDGIMKTDVNFNPLYVSERLDLGSYNAANHSYLVENASLHSNSSLSMSLVIPEHSSVQSQLGLELSHDFETRTGTSRLQLESDQPKLLFCNLVSAFKQLDDIWIRPAELEELMYCPATLNTIWKLVEIPFKHMVRIGVRFFRRVPGFDDLSYADKLRMCKDAVYPLWLVYHSSSFNMETQDFNWFTATAKERDLILAYIRPLNSLVGHFRSVGFSLQSLHLNEVERSFLAAMTVLSSSDGSCLEHPDAVFTLQDGLLDAFFSYQQEALKNNKSIPDGSDSENAACLTRASTRLAVMLARLAELKRANIEHCNVANQIIQSLPHIETGELWKEIFLNEGTTSSINNADAHLTTS